jgi:Flp pilus assembly protein TadG
MTVEFVIVVPLLMLWFVGSFVWFQAFRNYSQAEKASFAIADIVSRQTEVDNEFIDGLQPLFQRLQPRAGSGNWLRVSSISWDEDDGYAVEWSRNADGGDDLVTGDIPTSILPEMADGDTVILAETYVPYQPMVDWVGIPPLTWSNQVVIRPRYVSAISKTD